MPDDKRKRKPVKPKPAPNPGNRGVAADMAQVHRPTAPIEPPKPVGFWGWVGRMLGKVQK